MGTRRGATKPNRRILHEIDAEIGGQVMEFGREYLQKAINGDRKALSKAFVWSKTPQGHDYWSSQYRGKAPIDVDALKEILASGDDK
jgi:hypothetical protein